jgi:hypothetical protein
MYYAFTAIMEISPRCFHAACTITALLLHSFYDFTPILVGYNPATLILNMFKISVELPDHEDSAAIILRL